MGCTSSKQARYDFRHGLDSSFSRSNSMPSDQRIKRFTSCGGRYHIVSLRSSTLGSIKLDRDTNHDDEPMHKSLNDKGGTGGGGEFSSEDVDHARKWSDMIESIVSKTPSTTPPNEPETINVWELMAGLDDFSPIYDLGSVQRSYSFHGTTHNVRDYDGNYDNEERCDLMYNSKLSNGYSPPKPMRRKAMSFADGGLRTSLVQERIQAFQDKINAKKAKAKAVAVANGNAKNASQSYKCPPDGEDKVVFYFTSLRGIRKTHEDCCQTQLILKGYGVRLDERDISMHGGFKEELKEILGLGFGGCSLPRVFAAGRYMGGADEVREMHEAGTLTKALEGCERVSVGGAKEGGILCELCGDVRFVPCETCSGSCKVYVDEYEEEEEMDMEEGFEVGGFQRCPDCNENGLVRCPVCCGS